ncbi:MAG: hypothetical protein NT151_02355 [Acidobacteria bacterium]|nr:hypothetical protein [Acidobacteriota bacterium]
MRRVLHLAWFDALALRVPLAVWGVLLLVDGTIFYLGPIDNIGLPEIGRLSVTFGLAAVRWVATVVIVAMLVHADPTVGTTTFWRTRPISRLALLASKLISALLWLVVLPGVVATVVLYLLGLELGAASIGGSNASYEQAVIALMALGLAIVTRDMVQFIVAAVVGIGKMTLVRQVSFEVVTSGEPEAMWFRPVEVRSDLEFQDHSVATWARRWPGAQSPPSSARRPLTADDQPYKSIRQALGNPELVVPSTFKWTPYRLAVLEIPDAQFQRYRGQSARVNATVTMLAYRYSAGAAAPLKAGSRISISQRGVASIESVSRTPSGITVVMRQTYLEDFSGYRYTNDRQDFILRNATSRVALFGTLSGFRSAAYAMYFGMSHATTQVHQLFFSARDIPAGAAGMDDEWLKNAELVRMDTKVLGTVTRPLRIENFVLGAAQK